MRGVWLLPKTGHWPGLRQAHLAALFALFWQFAGSSAGGMLAVCTASGVFGEFLLVAVRVSLECCGCASAVVRARSRHANFGQRAQVRIQAELF